MRVVSVLRLGTVPQATDGESELNSSSGAVSVHHPCALADKYVYEITIDGEHGEDGPEGLNGTLLVEIGSSDEMVDEMVSEIKKSIGLLPTHMANNNTFIMEARFEEAVVRYVQLLLRRTTDVCSPPVVDYTDALLAELNVAHEEKRLQAYEIELQKYDLLLTKRELNSTMQA